MKPDLSQANKLFGSRGGIASAKALTPEQRTERARKAGKAAQAKRLDAKRQDS